MHKHFYLKLALVNIRKNGKLYFPYLLTGIGTVMMFYIMHALSVNEGLEHMFGGNQLGTIMGFGTVVIGIFAAILLFYTNSFLIKRRSRELGLYNILGMEKKHIGKLMLYETLVIALVTLALGLAGGILFSKLMFWVLLRILAAPVSLAFYVSVPSLGITVILFLAIFLVTLAANLAQVHMANPIELLGSANRGEKEPKTKWILALFGLLCLGGGYFIALWVESPLDALSLFFVAVLLVILGTYALFTAGSIVILKLLRKNKKFYYQTKHFTAVSGMIYRMKQNAVGLANICILSTMVLVMLSGTLSLYLGQEDVLTTRFPRDVAIKVYDAPQPSDGQLMQLVKEKAAAYDVAIEHVEDYTSFAMTVVRDGDHFTTGEPEGNPSASDLCELTLLTQEEYEKLTGQPLNLASGEAAIFSNRQNYGRDSFTLDGVTLRITRELAEIPIAQKGMNLVIDGYYLFVEDQTVIEQLIPAYLEENDLGKINRKLSFDIGGEKNNALAFSQALYDTLLSEDLPYGFSFESKEMERDDFLGLYGGFFFLGIFLGILFLMATVLIIYYKQVSEGYEDRTRFAIMQQVGMSYREVKKSIRTQVLMVFFLPLVMAVVHIAFAFRIIVKLLATLNMANVGLFLLCTLATILVFAIIYTLVFALTTRTYYRIVRSDTK